MLRVFYCTKIFFHSLIFTLVLMALPYPAFSLDVSSKVSTYYKIENQITYKVIHYGKGTFILPKGLRLPSNTILEGEGEDTKLVPMPKSPPYARFITNSDHINGNENIVVRNLKIEFNVPSLKGDSPGIVRFRGVTNLAITGISMDVKSNLYALDLSGSCRNALISACSVSNKGVGGCLMVRNIDRDPRKSSFAIKVSNNSFTSGIGDEPLAVFGWLGYVYDVMITGNYISATNSSFGLCAYGIDKTTDTGQLSKVTILGNTIVGGKKAGVAIKGGATQITVKSNSIVSSTQDGVFVHAGGDLLPSVSAVVISENTIKNVGRHGIYTSGYDLTITDNTIVNCIMCGVFVGNNVQVLRNTISNSNPGILVVGTQNRLVQNNVLVGSVIQVLNNDWLGISDNIIRGS